MRIHSMGMTVLLAPAKTPAAITSRLNRETVRALSTPDMKEKYLTQASEVVASSPEELAAAIRIDTAKWRKVIKEAALN